MVAGIEGLSAVVSRYRRHQGVDLWVPRTHPPSSGDHPVLVDEAAQTIGSSEPGEVDVAYERRSRSERRRRTLAERSVGTVGVVVLDVLGEHGL